MNIMITSSNIFLRFTGRVTASKTILLPLSNVSLSVEKDENDRYTLNSLSSCGHTLLADFDNEYDAVKTLHLINKKLHRHFLLKKTIRFCKGIFWPAAALALIVSLNGAAMNLGSIKSTNYAGSVTQPASFSPQISDSIIPDSQVIPPQLLNAIKQAAQSKKFTIRLSEGKARTLFVFSDPLCPHCRSFEPTLARLSQEYNIEIFPVSLVGNDEQITKSESINRYVLASDAGERVQRWNQVMRGEITEAVRSADSSEPDDRINANNQAFHLSGLTGTPSVLADNGMKLSLEDVKNPSKLAGLLSSGD